MVDASPLRPTVQKIKTKYSGYRRCHFLADVIWIQRLCSSDGGVKPLYRGLADALAQPITSQPQLSIMTFQPLFIVSYELKTRLSETITTQTYISVITTT